jgi:hypothetical protein
MSLSDMIAPSDLIALFSDMVALSEIITLFDCPL